MGDMVRTHKKSPMNMKFSSRRGLTTVVTTALMLSTVAVLGSALVAWSNGNLKVFEVSLSNTASNATNKITESMNIENIAFCHNCGGIPNSDNVVNVTVTNTGTVGMTVNQIQINGTTISKFYQSQNSLPANILPGQSYTISADLPTTQWHSQSPDTITVITARNSIYTTEAAPQ